MISNKNFDDKDHNSRQLEDDQAGVLPQTMFQMDDELAAGDVILDQEGDLSSPAPPQWPIARGVSWGLAVCTIVIIALALWQLRMGFEDGENLGLANQLLWCSVGTMLGLGCVLIFRIYDVWRSQSAVLSSTRLFRRLIGFSLVVASGPTFVISLIAVLVMTLALQGWFGDRVGAVVTDSLETADKALIEEHLGTKRSTTSRLADVTSRQIQRTTFLLTNREVADLTLGNSIRALGIDSAMLFGRDAVTGDITVFGRGGLAGESDLLSQIVGLDFGGISTSSVTELPGTTQNNYSVIIAIGGADDLFLVTDDAISSAIARRLESTRNARENFFSLSENITDFQQLFLLIFLVMALALALFAAWGGLRLATELSRPILRVTRAAQRLSEGRWDTRVPVSRLRANELDTLAATFNSMAADLGRQQEALRGANAALDERRRFTEAVLANVSAGVIGLDSDGNINLANEKASELLDRPLEQWLGLPLSEVAPAFMTLLDAAMSDPDGLFTEEVTITRRNGSPRQLLSNAVAEGDEEDVRGYVFTFDDVTDLQLAQRRAAWSDVARRIAHEIKNPLTPIQLSAERLKRRYLKEIENDPDLFSELVATIIRQVGQIGRMVDEFSGFARMPEPRLAEHDIREIVKHAVFLQANAFAQVEVWAEVPDDAITITVDEQLLNQAVINLVKNAAESLEASIANGTLEKGQVLVKIFTAEEADDSFELVGPRIEVRDNGSGYPVDLLPKLAEPYVTTREKGTGLGLAIVRKVMEDHGGELKLLNGDSQEKLCGARAVLLFSA